MEILFIGYKILELIIKWGLSTDLKYIAEKKNEIVLSNYDQVYLDLGLGGVFGDSYGDFLTWKMMYNNYNPVVPNIQGTIIGGETCMWGELNTDETHE